MKIGGLLRAVHGIGRGTRVAGSMTAVFLSMLLVISLQPRCELSPSIAKSANHGRASAITSVGVSYNHGFSACVSDESQEHYGHGASTGPALAKAGPTIAENTASSSDGDANAVILSLSFASAQRNDLTSAYSVLSSPLRLYLLYLHLLN